MKYIDIKEGMASICKGGAQLPNASSNIKIGDNFIRFENNSIKLSSVARTSLFKYRNIEYEEARKEYKREKEHFERERNNRVIIYFFATLVLILIATLLLSNELNSFGIVALIAAGICFIAYRVKKGDSAYPFAPPKKRDYPDRFGLGVELNSGYMEIFSALGTDGQIALNDLREIIDEATERKGVINFSMIDNSITVKNKDGIINFGDDSEIKNERVSQYE
ncbi:MAG: hypothetical protein FWC09_03645 [Lachnospiraceae bacterium]|nr:hypothetical protein [Lachnospiraceae bacterium]